MSDLLLTTKISMAYFPSELHKPVLDELMNSSGVGYKRFHNQVLRHVQIPGFASSTKAPVQYVVNTLHKDLSRKIGLAREVLVSWLYLDLDHCYKIIQYIDENYPDNVKKSYAERLDKDYQSGIETCGELLEAYAKHCEKELTKEEILQFIGVLLFRFLIPEEDDIELENSETKETEKEVAAARELPPTKEAKEVKPWDERELIRELSNLSPGLPIWDTFDSFIAELLEIRDEKLAQRTDWKRFNILLEKLQDQDATLYYLGLNVEELSEDNICSANVNEFIQLSTNLLLKLDKYNELLEQVPPDLRARRALEEQLKALESEIFCEFDVLVGLFELKETISAEVQELSPLEELDFIEEKSESVQEPAQKEKQQSIKESKAVEVVEIEIETEDAKLSEWDIIRQDILRFWWQMKAGQLQGESMLISESTLTSFLISEAILIRSLDSLHLEIHDLDISIDGPLEKELSFAIGAAISLSAAYGDSTTLLQPFGFSPNLDTFIESLREFGLHQMEWNISLETQTQQDRQMTLVRLREQAKTILEEVPNQRFAYARTGQIYRTIVGPDEEFGRILRLIASNDLSSAKEVKNCVRKWVTREHIQRQISDLDSRLRRKAEKEIVGHSLSQLVRLLESHIGVMTEWLEALVLEEHEASDFVEKQCRDLQEQGRQLLPQALKDIEAQFTEEISPKQGAALEILRRTIVNIQYFLELEDEPYTGMADFPSLTWYYKGAEQIKHVLGRRLLWHPELNLDEFGWPESLVDLEELELRCPQISWMFTEGLKQWAEKLDFRFTRLLLSLDHSLEEEYSLLSWLAEQEEQARLFLEQEAKETHNAIQKALVTGMLTDVTHTRYERIIAELKPETTKNVAAASKQLRSIRNELGDQIQSQIEQLYEEWEAKRETLIAGLMKEDLISYEEAVGEAYVQKDVRLLRELIESKAEFLKTQDQVGNPEYYKKFLDFRFKLEQNRSSNRALVHICADAIKRQKTWSGIPYAHLPVAHRNQAVEALQSWSTLYNQRPSHTKSKRVDKNNKIENSLESIFSFIGFTGVGENQITCELVKTGNNWLHYRAQMSSGVNARPFPQFGSLTNDRYDIICVWERPGADSLAGFIHDARLEAQGTIILFFGRLSDRLHREIAVTSRKRRLETAVLDESLLIFLTGFSDARLSAFLRASLPSSRIIPYTPNLRGDVPSEIFYGREDLVKDLQSIDGPCLMYGGRQMGKSALLRQVKRRFHDPKRMQSAWVEDIQHIGDALTGSSSADLWPRIWQAFERMDLIQARRVPERTEDIIYEIDSLFHERQDLRVLLLLDEADSFLNRDSIERFKVVSQLRSLMVDHQRRFRVVFTGLHNVQRYQSMPNQPLAHFGTPVRVGPLEPVAAMNLVREPLEALGFTLDDSCVLRILSFTNYHPGLIQVFCSRLLEQLYTNFRLMEGRRSGPLVISPEIIDNIYMSSDVRSEIRERFELTLSMDPRYHAIALYLAIYNRDKATSTFQPATVHAILMGLREWWSDAFLAMTNDEFKGLMIELENLGVVIEESNGAYQLRSPNLVSLLGTDEEISERFLDLIAQSRLDPEDNPDSYHALINPDNPVYSPLTFQQERSLDDMFDFRIITCSNALGLGNMEEAIKNIAKGFSSGDDTSKRVSASVTSGDQMLRFLKRSIDQTKKKGRQRLVIYQILQNQINLSVEAIEAAWKWFSQYTSKTKPFKLSLFFIMGPQAFSEAKQQNEDLFFHLDEMGLILRTRKWDLRGIDQCLRQFEKNAIESVKKSLLRYSGGWPLLLDEIMLRNGEEFDPTKIAQTTFEELLNDESARNHFLNGTGIMDFPEYICVLQKLAMENIPCELALPDLLNLEQFTEEEMLQIFDYYTTFGVISENAGEYMLDPIVKELLQHVEI